MGPVREEYREKITAYVEKKYSENENGEGVALTNNEIRDDVLGGRGYDNEFMSLRYEIQFGGSNIIPEKDPDTIDRPKIRQSMLFRVLSDEEYEKYRISGRNFKMLTDGDVKGIVSKIRKANRKVDKRTLWKLLTIVEVMAIKYPKNEPHNLVSAYFATLLVEQKNTLKDLLDLLDKAGVLEDHGKGMYSRVVEGELDVTEEKTDAAEKAAKTPKRTGRRGSKKEKPEEQTLEIDDEPKESEQLAEEIAAKDELDSKADEPAEKPRDEIPESLKPFIDEITAIVRERDELIGKVKDSKAEDALRDKVEKTESELKELKEKNAGIGDKVDSIVNRFSAGLMGEIIAFGNRPYDEDSKAKFQAKAMGLITDVTKSINEALGNS